MRVVPDPETVAMLLFRGSSTCLALTEEWRVSILWERLREEKKTEKESAAVRPGSQKLPLPDKTTARGKALQSTFALDT